MKKNALMKYVYYGTYSTCCRAALALYLARCLVIDIILQSQQLSNTFIICIKYNVLKRSQGISSKIIKYKDLIQFPTQYNITLLYRTLQSLSFSSSNTSPYITLPNFHLYHQVYLFHQKYRLKLVKVIGLSTVSF